MAPLPVENTARYVVHYTSGGELHTQDWRSGGPASPAAFEVFLDDVWGAASNLIFAATINDVVFYPALSTIGNSVAMPGFVGNLYGTGAPNNNLGALQVNFIGRSSGGRRTRVGFFSPLGVDLSWRYNAGEDPNVAAVITVLKANNDLVAIDGVGIIWKSYANVGYNAYWQRARRS